MKITDSWSIAGCTVLSFSDVDPDALVIGGEGVRIDGFIYPRGRAHNIGPRMAIKGEFDFTGKDVEIIYSKIVDIETACEKAIAAMGLDQLTLRPISHICDFSDKYVIIFKPTTGKKVEDDPAWPAIDKLTGEVSWQKSGHPGSEEWELC